MNNSLRTYFGLGVISFCVAILNPNYADAQKICGHEIVVKNMREQTPEQYKQLQEKYQADAAIISAIEAGQIQAKTTATTPIPVAFHFVLTSSQYSTLGRDSGIMRRVVSQLKVLNQDFAGTNPDLATVPGPFKIKSGKPAISFARAGKRTPFTIAAGVEVKIITTPTTYNADDLGAAAKDPNTGLAAWDNSKYLNIWVTRLSTSGGGKVLGVTTPPYLVGFNVGGHTVAANETGMVMDYGAFGKKEFVTQYFFGDADGGRTLTHEMGHFFELVHIWGDDDNSDTVTRCTTYAGGYDDDFVNDTPPQGKRTQCTPNCPTYPLLDKCSPVAPGVMFMSFMDYVVDSAMHLFSAGQATRMNYYLSTESVGLTQHPELLGVDDAQTEVGAIALSPNPTTGAVRLNLERTEGFQGAVVVNMMGQTIKNIIAVPGAKTYNFELSSAPRGIYLVQCKYDGGTITQKLVLE